MCCFEVSRGRGCIFAGLKMDACYWVALKEVIKSPEQGHVVKKEGFLVIVI